MMAIVGVAVLAAAGLGMWTVMQARAERQRVEEMLRDSLRPRIVSLAPALTEALYALNLGDHVVAVSRFCDYPPEVKDLPTVGGLADVDVETVIRMVPDVVVLPPAQAHLRETLLRLKDPPHVLTVRTDRLEDIYNAMWKIGENLERTKEAEAWLGDIEKIMARAERAVRLKKETAEKQSPGSVYHPPKVLLCIGREGEKLERMWIAGPGTFYHDIIGKVGGVNAYTGVLSYPAIATEGLLQMNPDIIIEVCLPAGGVPVNTAQIIAQWSRWKEVSAVQRVHIYVIEEEWAVRPGPRVGLLVERLLDIVTGYN